MMKWFKDCTNIEEVKELYKKLCRKHHPDVSGYDSTATMQEINAEFTEAFNALKNKHRTESKEQDNSTADEAPEEFINIINTLINCEGLEIMLVGCWIWLEGNTYPYKDIIKSLGFKWASRKKAWYFRREEDACRSRKNISLEDIKSKYGCKTFGTVSMPKLATA